MSLRIAATLSALLFLFIFATGQVTCLCDKSDNCTGFANEFSQLNSHNLATDECAAHAKPNMTATDDCCANCPSESTVGGIRAYDGCDEQIEKRSLNHSPWTNVFRIAEAASAQWQRPPPNNPTRTRVPTYIFYRALLI